MTLHTAIEKLLQQTGRQMTTQEIADSLNKNKWYQKKDGSKITDFQIHGRTRNYPQLFNRNGTTVSLAGQSAIKLTKPKLVSNVVIKTAKPNIKDEHYVLDICDKILKQPSSRQHKFDFLLGDTNANGIAAKLPVDAYYEKLKLVIEYREKQHTESVTFFDKPNRMTISGVHRGEQRKIYDERRKKLLPANGLTLVEVSYMDFNHDRQKRIVRNEMQDTEIIRKLLKKFIDRL
jgi:hypothetical protein